jgi:hypothetical protein
MGVSVRPHVFVPDPADLLGEACAVTSCEVKRANAVHVDPAEVPTDTRYEQEDADGR